jgi:hypothetical protein
MCSHHNNIKLIHMVLVAAVLLISGALSSASAQQTARTDLPIQDSSLYAVEPQPLTIDQCGQCHSRHFKNLKQAGGLHQFDCRECHEVFHAYNPLRDNYAAIMPQCATCHTLPHGEKHAQCLSCHQNPHTPRQVAMTDNLAGLCSSCHATQAEQLQAAPSKHTQQPCNSCHHDRHGYIPVCSECHEPHFESQAMETCTQCHDVHQPLNISLSETVDVHTCNACHDSIYAKWSATPSKHGKVSCASCHTRHGLIPECTNCHTPPKSHAEKLLEMFPKCLTCHLDVHDLPVKNKVKSK